MQLAKLVRLASVHQNLRTPEVVGTLIAEPTVGGRIHLLSFALEGEGYRTILSSDIVQIDTNYNAETDVTTRTIQTANSVYILKTLGATYAD